MNTPNDLRWILFATVPVHGYASVDVARPIVRGIARLLGRISGSGQHGNPEITKEGGKSPDAPAALVDHPVP
jgi:hypothetical protein